MKLAHVALIVLLSIVTTFVTTKFLMPALQPVTTVEAQKETAYERVMRTKTLNCAYVLWPPFMTKDANTGAFGGMNYELMNAIGDSLGFKVNWANEISSGTQVETLRSGKGDAICSAEGPLEAKASAYLAYTDPIAFFPFYAYVRIDDARFTTNDLARLNEPDVRMVVIDGDVTSEVAHMQFPKAQLVAQAQFTESSQMMLNVVNNKADVFVSDELSMVDFLKNNPGKLRKMDSGVITVIPNTFSTLREELVLNDMLSQALRNLQGRGAVEPIFAKYKIGTEVKLYMPSLPYTKPQ